MKELLAAFLKIKQEDIETYKFNTNHTLSIGSESDYGREYSIIEGEINEPQYEIITKLPQRYYWVNLEELLVFLYNKKK